MVDYELNDNFTIPLFLLCLGKTLNIVLIVIYRCTYVIYFTYTYYTVKYKNTSLLKAYNFKMASLKIYPNNIKHFIKLNRKLIKQDNKQNIYVKFYKIRFV